MENILRNTVFFLCTFLSCASFAEVEETFTYGTQTSTEPLSFDAWNHMVYGVFPGGAASQVAGSEYSNYRADFEKRKYCKANNYPKNVSFCAGYKEKECNTVKSGAPIDQKSCMNDVEYRGTILTEAQCGNTSPTSTSGTFSWNYTFQGKFYGFKANIPAQSYDEFSWYSDQLACEKIISNAVTFIQANCETQAQYAVHEKCNQ
jgi:hypothetical protein